MTWQYLQTALTKVLLSTHGRGETASIIRIYLEDRFKLAPGFSGELSEKESAIFKADLEAFQKGMPVQYIVGKAAFYGYFFNIDPSVLIPRVETEELVYQVLESTRVKASSDKELRILDIGTGSGCIAISLSKKLPRATVLAIDVSGEALELARQNNEVLGATVEFRQLDFLDEKSWPGLGSFDIVVSNPPYISKAEKDKIPPGVLNFEPHTALFPEDSDVMIFYRKIFDFSVEHLKPGGEVFMEISEFRVGELESILADHFADTEAAFIKDLQNKDRILHLLP